MKKVIYILTLFFILNTVIFAIFNSKLTALKSEHQNTKIEVYEIIENDNDTITELDKIEFEFSSEYQTVTKNYFITSIFANTIFLILIIIYTYLTLIKPFNKLGEFSLKLSKGILDEPLPIHNNSVFHNFSSSFDLMRDTIKATRESEARLIEENKTIISTLSHDIKTPIASIKLASDYLKSDNLDHNTKARYLNIISDKVKEVTNLSDDLFMHSLTSMDKLIVKKETLNLNESITHIINTFNLEYQINIENSIPNVNIYIEQKRLTQIFNNILENSKKYANGCVWIRFEVIENNLKIYIKDDGKGIDPEDISFIFNKFYKGSSSAEGAGLGLYIVKYILESIDGDITVKNSNGALFTLTFPIKSNS